MSKSEKKEECTRAFWTSVARGTIEVRMKQTLAAASICYSNSLVYAIGEQPLSVEDLWVMMKEQLEMLRPGGFCGTCHLRMDATGHTEKFPECNTWTCPKCGLVEAESGSVADRTNPEQSEVIKELVAFLDAVVSYHDIHTTWSWQCKQTDASHQLQAALNECRREREVVDSQKVEDVIRWPGSAGYDARLVQHSLTSDADTWRLIIRMLRDMEAAETDLRRLMD